MTSYTDAINQLLELQNLPEGWDYGSDGPPTQEALKASLAALHSLNFLSAQEYDILPGIENGVSIVAVRNDLVAEIHANFDGSFNFVHERSGEENCSLSNISFESLTCKLEELGWPSTRLFVSCTHVGLAKDWADIHPNHFDPEATDVFPLSVPGACPIPGVRYVNTSKNTTSREYQERHRSSGKYKQHPFQLMSA